MCRKMLCILAVSCVLGMVGCSDDKTEEVRQRADVEETLIQKELDWRGGEYVVAVNYEPMTRVIEPWSYRVTIDGVVAQSVEVSEQISEIKVTIPANYTEKEREVVVEVKSPKSKQSAPKWIKAIWGLQQSPLIKVGSIYWAKANLTILDGKFTIADKPEDFGHYFKHLSDYAIPSEGDSYNGVAYNPAATTIALTDIPEKSADPCMLMSDGALRMPTFGELEALNRYNSLIISSLNGVNGIEFDNGNLFLPCAGACDVTSGMIGQKNASGFYWSSGYDAYGDAARLFFNNEWSIVWFIDPAVTTVGNVRCVRNTAKASYVSHTPQNLENNEACTVQIVTEGGTVSSYFVELNDLTNKSSYFDELSGGRRMAEIELPKNRSLEAKVYEIFIDSDPVGVQIIQPGKKNFADYVSHTPKGPVADGEFTLTVTCESDLDAFDVEIKSGGETVEKKTASKTNLVVEFTISANEGPERSFEIWVNGIDTGKSVVQEAPKPKFSVVWSSGYLTIKDGAYTFAGEQEMGMFFKFKSRYGMTLDKAPATGANYSGTAYGPVAEQKAYTDITHSNIDPCTLVDDGKSWRMPTKEEWDELLEFDYAWEMNKYRAYTDPEQTVYLTPSGSIKNTGKGMLATSYVRVWSSTPDADKIFAISGGLSSKTSSFKPTSAGATPDIAMMVRCVRAK